MPEGGTYPWGGDVSTGEPSSPAAVATMGARPPVPAGLAAAWGPLHTENIGIETLVANVLSNPRIRFLVLFGDDVRGHLAGASLVALHRAGVDERRRIVGAPGAMPFIENIGDDAVERFRRQVELVDLLGVRDLTRLEEALLACRERDPGPMDGPFAVARLRRPGGVVGAVGGLALHAALAADPYGSMGLAEGWRPRGRGAGADAGELAAGTEARPAGCGGSGGAAAGTELRTDGGGVAAAAPDGPPGRSGARGSSSGGGATGASGRCEGAGGGC